MSRLVSMISDGKKYLHAAKYHRTKSSRSVQFIFLFKQPCKDIVCNLSCPSSHQVQRPFHRPSIMSMNPKTSDPSKVTPKPPEALLRSAKTYSSARAAELQWEVPLVSDPLAKLLSSASSYEWYTDNLARTTFHCIRHRFFDDRLSELCAEGDIVNVISLGAGMETRPYRLECMAGKRFFQLDNEIVLEEKQRLIREGAPTVQPIAKEIISIAADFRKLGWVHRLRECGVSRDVKTVWIMEGLLYYIPQDMVHAIFDAVSELSAPGSPVIFSALNSLEAFSGKKSSFESSMPEPERFLEKHGLRVRSVDGHGSPSARFGRSPKDRQCEPDEWKALKRTIEILVIAETK